MELSVLAQHGLMVAIAALILPGMIVNWVSGLRIPWAAAAGIPTTLRDTRGKEIDGACGQLAAEDVD